MDNHLRLLLRLDSGRADGWTGEEVARRCARLFPPKEEKGQGEQGLEVWIAAKAADGEWVASTRLWQPSLSWFMKCLKEPIARLLSGLRPRRSSRPIRPFAPAWNSAAERVKSRP